VIEGLQGIGKHRAHIAYVNFLDDCTVSESSLLLCSFLGQDMALVGMLALDLTGTGNLEPLLST